LIEGPAWPTLEGATGDVAIQGGVDAIGTESLGKPEHAFGVSLRVVTVAEEHLGRVY
jgi:hypothetical protein